MGEVLEKHDCGNNQKITQKGCIPFCHSPFKIMFQKWFPLHGAESHEKKTKAEQP
jgi:hypothetical protein